MYVILGIVGIFGTSALLSVGLKHASPINASRDGFIFYSVSLWTQYKLAICGDDNHQQ